MDQNTQGLLLCQKQPLLHRDRQIHAWMDAAIVVVGSGCVEWTNCFGLVGRTEHHIAHGWRACLGLRHRCIAVPTAIADDMRGGRLVVERDALALFNRNRVWRES